jgi:hypothetical protein
MSVKVRKIPAGQIPSEDFHGDKVIPVLRREFFSICG